MQKVWENGADLSQHCPQTKDTCHKIEKRNESEFLNEFLKSFVISVMMASVSVKLKSV